MNIDSAEFFLLELLILTASLVLFIYPAKRILDSIKASGPLRTPLRTGSSPYIVRRRRQEIRPGIVCLLPIHGQGSYDEALS